MASRSSAPFAIDEGGRPTEFDDKICALDIVDGGSGEKQRGQTPLPRQLVAIEVEVCHLLERRIVRLLI